MTDLSKGIIEINGLKIDGTTPKTAICTLFANNISPISNENLIYINTKLFIDEFPFICTFRFSDEEDLMYIELYPCISYTSEEWDRTGQQEERRKFCDKWLYDRLGDPHKVLRGDIEYTFSNIRISCFSNFDIHQGPDAGYVVVRYLR